jgi:hypothetical protein
VTQLDIKAWRKPNLAGAVFTLKPEKADDGSTRPPNKPAGLMDGDIIIKADHHIGFVNAQGAIFEAQDTHLGVRSTSIFSLESPGDWTHLVRLSGSGALPAPEWPLGWWKVWDGNTYFYFFSDDGIVKFTKTTPYNTRTPPTHWNNVGRYSYTPPNRLVITWNSFEEKRDLVPDKLSSHGLLSP